MIFQKKPKASQAKRPLDRFIAIDGLMITDGSKYWFIRSGKRMKCFSDRSFESWGLDAILLNPSAINSIKPSGTLGFRDGSLIKDIVSGKIYLISQSKARLVADPDILDIIGRDKIIEVSPDEVNIHTLGEVISGQSERK